MSVLFIGSLEMEFTPEPEPPFRPPVQENVDMDNPEFYS